MPTKARNESDGLQARGTRRDEGACSRAANRGKEGAKAADGVQAVLDRNAEMAPAAQALAERVQVAVSAAAPELSLKIW